MSAPDTNIDRQAKRHWASIAGICVALTLGVVIGLGIASVIDLNGPQVSATEAQTGGAVTSGD